MISASLVKELRDKTGAGMMDAKKALENTNGDIEKAIEYLRENGIVKAGKKESRIAAEGLAKVYINNNKAVILEINSETDFVSKNEEFIGMFDIIGKAILANSPKTMEDALNLQIDSITIQDYLVEKIAKIGEKISFRRFEIVEKNDDEVFGEYIHMGGKIAVLTLLKGANTEIAKDVAMHSAAMKPQYIAVENVPADIVDSEKEILKNEAINEGKPADIAEKMVEGRIKKFFAEICLSEQAFVKDGDITVGKYVANNGGSITNMIRYEVGEGMEKRSDNFAEEVMNQVSNN